MKTSGIVASRLPKGYQSCFASVYNRAVVDLLVYVTGAERCSDMHAHSSLRLGEDTYIQERGTKSRKNDPELAYKPPRRNQQL